MADEARGFASMDATSRREMARKGGRAAHQRGTAHEWTREEAREAGRKGGGVLLRSGDDAPASRLPGTADALDAIADTLEDLARERLAASIDLVRSMRMSLSRVSDALDRIEAGRLHPGRRFA